MDWTFLTNYAHVLVCLSFDPTQRLRDIANQVGITERAVQRIVHDLHADGYISISKEGRRNHYKINPHKKLRHPMEKRVAIRELLNLTRNRSV